MRFHMNMFSYLKGFLLVRSFGLSWNGASCVCGLEKWIISLFMCNLTSQARLEVISIELELQLLVQLLKKSFEQSSRVVKKENLVVISCFPLTINKMQASNTTRVLNIYEKQWKRSTEHEKRNEFGSERMQITAPAVISKLPFSRSFYDLSPCVCVHECLLITSVNISIIWLERKWIEAKPARVYFNKSTLSIQTEY